MTAGSNLQGSYAETRRESLEGTREINFHLDEGSFKTSHRQNVLRANRSKIEIFNDFFTKKQLEKNALVVRPADDPDESVLTERLIAE